MTVLRVIAFLYFLFPNNALGESGKKVKYRKTQTISFDGSSVDGVSRNPEGSYLVQKRGVSFLPLYKVKDSFDQKVLSSMEYAK